MIGGGGLVVGCFIGGDHGLVVVSEVDFFVAVYYDDLGVVGDVLEMKVGFELHGWYFGFGVMDGLLSSRVAFWDANGLVLVVWVFILVVVGDAAV